MVHFHTEWNEVHMDWQCRCGAAMGAGATPEAATQACLDDIVWGDYANATGWLGTPETRNPIIEHEHSGWSWVAYWYEEPYRYQCTGVGDTPEEATLDLLERFCAM